ASCALQSQLPNAAAFTAAVWRGARNGVGNLGTVAAQVWIWLALPLGQFKINFVISRAAPDFDAGRGWNAGVEHHLVPDAIGDLAVERGLQPGLRIRTGPWGQYDGRFFVPGPTLHDERRPTIHRIVVPSSSGDDQASATEQPHRYKLGSQVQ